MPDPKPEFDLGREVKDATRLYFGCKACKGIRYKSCPDCGQKPNSFGDFRDSQRPRQVYETQTEWREVNGTPEQNVPDRKLQP